MLRSLMLLCTTLFMSASTSEPPAISKALEEPRTAPFDCDPELQGLLCPSDLPAAEFADVSEDLAAGSKSTIASSPHSSNRDIRGNGACTKSVRRPVGSCSAAMQAARQRSYVTQCRIETARKSI